MNLNKVFGIESPFAPDLSNLNPSDTLTDSQEVLSTTISNTRTTVQQAIEYIKRTKQVINTLHEIVDNYKRKDRLQRELLKHCLTQLENPKPRNQDLIINAIKQHLDSHREGE